MGVVPDLFRAPPGTLARIASMHSGAVIAVLLGPTRIYLVTHPDHVESVLNDQWRNFGKSGGIWKPLRKFFGYGLVTSEGELWIRHRRILQPLFSQKAITTMADTMTAKIERYLDGDLRRLAEVGRTVNIAQQMNLLTESVLLETLFGASVDRRESNTLAHALNSALRVLNLRALFYFIPEFIPSPGQRTFRHATLTIDDILLRLFEARRRDRRDPGV
jgi:cytochrome P450